jgi:tetratricopeptide (TPR) repeat protein
MSEPPPPPLQPDTCPPAPPSTLTGHWPALPPPADTPALPQVPGYEVLAILGKGGMGVVYRAKDMGLGRLVALKMVRGAGAADPEDLLRLRAEAESIARLQHPHIVQIFEVGTYHGLPYLALEYCGGGTLEGKLAGTPLPPAEAAARVEQLARAMHAAHLKGIVHRDLKPANVLLAEDGTPKITDFGLAKTLGTAGQTAVGTVLGTPSYMAPEQADGKGRALTPACDIYALGAVLYECLTGRPPFKAASTYETVMQVLEVEPVPPTQLNPRVPGDLETICLKCLHKEAARRYATALELADDLGRWQRGEPVLARPVGTVERLTKWARRRPAVAALSGALLAATLLLIAALTTGLLLIADALRNTQEAEHREAAQRQTAELSAAEERKAKFQAQKAADAERLAKVMAEKRLQQFAKSNEILASVFRDLDPVLEEKGGLPLRAQLGERLDRAAELLHGDAVGDPLTVARLQLWLGRSLLNLGYPVRAIALGKKARPVLEADLGPDHRETLVCLNDLAEANREAGLFAEALALHEETLKRRQASLGPDHPETLQSMNNLGATYRAAGQAARAVPLLEHVVAKRKETLPPEDPQVLASLNNLALCYWDLGELSRALPLLQQVLERTEAALGPTHIDTLLALSNLGLVYQIDGQWEKSLPLLEQALQKRKTALGPDHPDTLTSMNNLAMTYRALGRLTEALALCEETYRKEKAKKGADHPDTLQCQCSLAMLWMDNGDLEKALPILEETLAKRKLKLPPDHPETLKNMDTLGMAYRANGQPAKALPLVEEALAKRKEKLGPDHPDTLTSMNNLAVVCLGVNQRARALELFQEVLAKRKVKLAPDHPETLTTMNNVAMTYQALGRHEEALPLLQEALAKQQARLGPDHPDTLNTLANLGMVYFDLRRHADAAPLLAEWVARRRPQLPPDHLGLAYNLSLLGQCQVMLLDYFAAEQSLRESLVYFDKQLPQFWMRHHTASVLGAALAKQRRYGSAEPVLVAAARALRADVARLGAAQVRLLFDAMLRVIDLYDAWGRSDDAAKWRREVAVLRGE